MPNPEPAPISNQLKARLLMHGRPLTEVAEQAGVEYQPLWRWYSGKTEKYDVDSADRVWKFLTGKGF